MSQYRDNDRELINQITDLIELHSKKQDGQKILKSFNVRLSSDLKIVGYVVDWKFKKNKKSV